MERKSYLQRKNSKRYEKLNLEIGIDEIISPENLASQEISLLVNNCAFTNSHDFESGKLKMLAAIIQNNAPLL